MSEFTDYEKYRARYVLGLVRKDGTPVNGNHDISRECLLYMLELNEKVIDQQIEIHAEEIAKLQKEIEKAKKAKNLANARADEAVERRNRFISSATREDVIKQFALFMRTKYTES